MNRNEKPLTLDELREMDGKPLFGVSLITGKPGEYFICRIVNMSKAWFVACAGASQGFGDKDTYGETWVAYDTEPPCIDREAWEPCEYCGDPSPHSDCVIEGNVEQFLCARDGLFGDAYINTRKIEYCPYCGRPLTDSAWKQLEERFVEK